MQFVIGFHTPLSCCFYFRYLSLYCNFIWFILCSLSLLISESIYVLSSHVHPQCHQIIVVLCLALLFLDFGYFCLLWNCWDFDLLVPFIFSLSSYLCLDLHKFLYINSIVFIFWSLAVFFQFFQNPLFYILCAGCFVSEIYFSLIGNIWFSGLCKIEVLQKIQKKNQLKRVNRKKMINILKTVCKFGRYSWCNWTLNLKNLLKKMVHAFGVIPTPDFS